ncbi:hypothetical protein MN608_09871 [Microdochium nivale]|nr:hypothetical protein MN608_09871 [Microdochium nivale]
MASSSKDVDIDNAVAGEQRPRLDPVPRNASMENDGDILSLTSPQETHSGHRQSRDSMRHGVGSPNRPQSRGRFVPPADYETPVKSSSIRSSRPLRFSSYDDARDDEYYHNGHNNYQYAPDRGGESFRDEGRHYSDRSSRRPSQRRPPQAYMNRQYNFSRDVPPSPESAMGGKTLLEDRYYED